MREIHIDSFQKFHDAIQHYDTNRDVYRGVVDAAYELVPKLGRPSLKFRKPVSVMEKELLRLFRDLAAPYLPKHTISDWELLAIAQHHGLPTRLLDWSRNPLVAAYFAVEHKFDGDSAVYVLKGKKFLNIKDKSPFEVEEVSKFIPSHITPRITVQSGLFTVHPVPTEPLTSSSVDKLVITNKFRLELKKTLYRYGVHRASLFPDLDGIASHIQWLKTDSH